MTDSNSNIKDLTMKLDIDATPETVWTALTDNIAEWWPAEFFSGGEAGKQTFTLEGRPGGRMFEEWESGDGALWGTVVTAQRAKKLQVLGAVFPQWGGPNQWFGTWELTPSSGGTTLQYSESVVGRITDAGVGEKDKGWSFLWACLKAHIEKTDPPVWSD